MDEPQFSDDEAEQLRTLLLGGDTTLHHHEFDRNLNHDSSTMIEFSRKTNKITANYTVSYKDDYLFVDTTAGAVILTLPVAKGGNKYTIVRIAGANNITVQRSSTDTVNGAASITISASYSPVSLKAVKGTGYIQV